MTFTEKQEKAIGRLSAKKKITYKLKEKDFKDELMYDKSFKIDDNEEEMRLK